MSADCIKLDVFEKQVLLECSDPAYHLEVCASCGVLHSLDAHTLLVAITLSSKRREVCSTSGQGNMLSHPNTACGTC